MFVLYYSSLLILLININLQNTLAFNTTLYLTMQDRLQININTSSTIYNKMIQKYIHNEGVVFKEIISLYNKLRKRLFTYIIKAFSFI